MTRIYRTHRMLGILAGLICAAAWSAATAPAAHAINVPPPGGGGAVTDNSHTVHTVFVGGGMPGWQITLIAAAAALLGAVIAVLFDRARTRRRVHPVTA